MAVKTCRSERDCDSARQTTVQDTRQTAAMPLVALITAFFAAVVSVRFMVNALGKYGLAPFGYYRIILAVACVVWLID